MKAVITGSSRGIGLELTQLALQQGLQVMAVARNPEKSSGLLKLKGDFKDKLEIVTADLHQPDASERISAVVKDWEVVDILVNNAGIMRQGVRREDFLDSFLINSVVPFELTTALLPFLKKSSRPVVAHITSLMGSITDNSGGSYYAYRSSKAALNMIHKSLSQDYPWLSSVVLHPGWVKTEMGGPQAQISTGESALGLWKVIEGMNTAKSGNFYDYRGNELPW